MNTWKFRQNSLDVQRGPLSVHISYGNRTSGDWGQKDTPARKIISIEAQMRDSRLCLENLLPPDWNIIECNVVSKRSDGHANATEKRVTIPQYQWNPRHTRVLPFFACPESFETLLHEMGHAQLSKNPLTEDAEEALAASAFIGHVPDKNLKGFLELLEGESAANAFALNQIAIQRTGGLDLEPNRSMHDIRQTLNDALKSHEKLLDHCLEEAAEKELLGSGNIFIVQ